MTQDKDDIRFFPYNGFYCLVEVEKDKTIPDYKIQVGNLTLEKAEEYKRDWEEDNDKEFTIVLQDDLRGEEGYEYWGD